MLFGLLDPRCLLDCHVLKGFGIHLIGILDRLYTDLVKSCLQALPVCSLVNSKGMELPFLCKAPRPSARVLTLRHAPTSRHDIVRAREPLVQQTGAVGLFV